MLFILKLEILILLLCILTTILTKKVDSNTEASRGQARNMNEASNMTTAETMLSSASTAATSDLSPGESVPRSGFLSHTPVLIS